MTTKKNDSVLTIALTEQELNRLKTDAIKAGLEDNWQAYATKEFREKVCQSLIGSPTIKSPKTVTGPSRSFGQEGRYVY